MKEKKIDLSIYYETSKYIEITTLGQNYLRSIIGKVSYLDLKRRGDKIKKIINKI